MAEAKRGDSDGGRSAGRHTRNQGILRGEDFLRLRLCPDWREIRQSGIKRQRVGDRLVIQVADHAVRFLCVNVRVPHRAERCGEHHRQDRDGD
jgi:hypothetical protein